MAIITLDTRDRRDIKALTLAAQAGQWLKLRTHAGQAIAYGIPSSRIPHLYYRTTASQCSCKDAEFGNDCYHCRAVRLHVALVGAMRSQRAA